jgi:isoleucyl-tRNA synthetase
LEQDVEPSNYSQQLIKSAYDYFVGECRQFVAESGAEWRARLTELQEWLDESAQVVSITVATEADAFLIFETLKNQSKCSTSLNAPVRNHQWWK